MFERDNYNSIPTQFDMSNYINNSLWEEFCEFIKEQYGINPKFEFSKCSMEYGWNIKLKKGSKSLCTVYPRENYFCVMVVVNKKIKKSVDNLIPSLSGEMKQIYLSTNEVNGQKWLMIDLEDKNNVYDDLKKLIQIRWDNF